MSAAAQTPCDSGTWQDCDLCVSRNLLCSDVFDACSAEPDCVFLFSCVDGCDSDGADESCYQACYAQYPAGLDEFRAEQRCYICAQCPTASDDAAWAYYCCEPSSPLP